MVICETSIFSKKITTLLDDEEYRTLQNALVEKPHLGDIANVQQNDNVRGELVEPHSTLRQTQGERFYYQIKVR